MRGDDVAKNTPQGQTTGNANSITLVAYIYMEVDKLKRKMYTGMDT